MENKDKVTQLRTDNQNRALHKFCQEVADECVNKGITYKVLLEGLDVEPSAENIKDMFRAVGKTLFNQPKTSKMTIAQLSEVTNKLMPRLAEKGIESLFPSQEILHYEQILAQRSMKK